jgi:hypothetical protein
MRSGAASHLMLDPEGGHTMKYTEISMVKQREHAAVYKM